MKHFKKGASQFLLTSIVTCGILGVVCILREQPFMASVGGENGVVFAIGEAAVSKNR